MKEDQASLQDQKPKCCVTDFHNACVCVLVTGEHRFWQSLKQSEVTEVKDEAEAEPRRESYYLLSNKSGKLNGMLLSWFNLLRLQKVSSSCILWGIYSFTESNNEFMNCPHCLCSHSQVIVCLSFI